MLHQVSVKAFPRTIFPLSASLSHMAVADCFALGEFLILNHNICGIDFYAVFVHIAACLDPAADSDLDTLTKIFFCKFSLSSKSNASDKVCCSFPVSLETAVSSWPYLAIAISFSCRISPQDLWLNDHSNYFVLISASSFVSCT